MVLQNENYAASPEESVRIRYGENKQKQEWDCLVTYSYMVPAQKRPFESTFPSLNLLTCKDFHQVQQHRYTTSGDRRFEPHSMAIINTGQPSPIKKILLPSTTRRSRFECVCGLGTEPFSCHGIVIDSLDIS